jgi:hypothetical protein
VTVWPNKRRRPWHVVLTIRKLICLLCLTVGSMRDPFFQTLVVEGFRKFHQHDPIYIFAGFFCTYACKVQRQLYVIISVLYFAVFLSCSVFQVVPHWSGASQSFSFLTGGGEGGKGGGEFFEKIFRFVP